MLRPKGVCTGLNRCYYDATIQLLAAVSTYDQMSKKMMGALPKWKSPFVGNQQEDAHYCLMSILDQLGPPESRGTLRSTVVCSMSSEKSESAAR